MWITRHEKDKKSNKFSIGMPLTRFIRRFYCLKRVAKAELKISALGIFRVEINGREIDEYFMPGYTNYNKYVLLCSYDITKNMQEENRITVTVGDGWFAGRLGYTSERAIFGEKTRLYATIRLIYEDGTEETIETDDTWKAYQSEIQYADFFNGEYIDENKRIDAFAEYERLDNAEIVTENRRFEAYNMEPVVCVNTLTPKQTKKNKSILLDFGQNFAGVVNFSAQGKKGLKIMIRHAEMLSMDGELYMDNLRSARCTDTLILSDKPCKFEPKFTYHVFGEKFTVLCKALAYDKYSEIQENCIDMRTKEPTFDLQKLQIELVFNGVFNAQDGTRFFSNKDLHKKFKVPNGKEFIKKLLLSGEISVLADTITELTGFKGDLIEEVKN